MIVYLARDIPAFVMYCVSGESGSSLLIYRVYRLYDNCVLYCFSGYFNETMTVTYVLEYNYYYIHGVKLKIMYIIRLPHWFLNSFFRSPLKLSYRAFAVTS